MTAPLLIWRSWPRLYMFKCVFSFRYLIPGKSYSKSIRISLKIGLAIQTRFKYHCCENYAMLLFKGKTTASWYLWQPQNAKHEDGVNIITFITRLGQWSPWCSRLILLVCWTIHRLELARYNETRSTVFLASNNEPLIGISENRSSDERITSPPSLWLQWAR